MKVGILFSGGKDSTMALYYALKEQHQVSCLITLFSENKDSYMFHSINVEYVKKQAEALEIPIIIGKTKGEKEKELDDMKAILTDAKKEYSIEGVYVGALASKYQSDRVNKICDEIGLKVFAPLWKKDEEEYLLEVVNEGFKVLVVSIAADGLNKDMLGKVIDNEMIKQFKKIKQKTGFHLGAEGGEYESFVIDGPIFKKKLEVISSRIEMESEICGKYFIDEIELKEK